MRRVGPSLDARLTKMRRTWPDLDVRSAKSRPELAGLTLGRGKSRFGLNSGDLAWLLPWTQPAAEVQGRSAGTVAERESQKDMQQETRRAEAAERAVDRAKKSEAREAAQKDSRSLVSPFLRAATLVMLATHARNLDKECVSIFEFEYAPTNTDFAESGLAHLDRATRTLFGAGMGSCISVAHASILGAFQTVGGRREAAKAAGRKQNEATGSSPNVSPTVWPCGRSTWTPSRRSSKSRAFSQGGALGVH